jgi:glyoxylase-like metal-dependent hydrolase (beta-lactamase superfamily II)
VVISHFHTDHVNGLLTADGKPAFPNAEVLVPATEWKFWMDDGEMSRAPAGRMQGLFKNNRNIFESAGFGCSYRERLKTKQAPPKGHTHKLSGKRTGRVDVPSMNCAF